MHYDHIKKRERQILYVVYQWTRRFPKTPEIGWPSIDRHASAGASELHHGEWPLSQTNAT